jgi:hypothetical protein
VRLELADEPAQPVLGVGRVGGLVECRPVGTPDSLVERAVVRQLAQHVADSMHHPDAIGDLRLTVTIPFVPTMRPLVLRRRRDAHFP